MLSALLLLGLLPVAGDTNLAVRAAARASESDGDLTPALAIDGDPDTRWSVVPGSNAGQWLELEWAEPVTIAEVVVHQFDRYVMELDVEVREEAGGGWRGVRHHGTAGKRLPAVLVSRFAPVRCSGLRIGGITNGPSFTEVEVYGRRSPPVVELAGDLRGRLIGVVTDRFGSGPIAGVDLVVTGESGAGPFSLAALFLVRERPEAEGEHSAA